jgi:predicted ATP-dependent endonuclease of OLD family
MIINRVTIGGFRNIEYTVLEFDEPIIFLASQNNLGKSNLLKAIQDGFNLIAKQGIQIENYIENSDNYANWNINQSESGNFTFEVEYIRNFDPDTTYTYRFSLGYRAE